MDGESGRGRSEDLPVVPSSVSELSVGISSAAPRGSRCQAASNELNDGGEMKGKELKVGQKKKKGKARLKQEGKNSVQR